LRSFVYSEKLPELVRLTEIAIDFVAQFE
jgi:hypothetical protein